MSEPLTKLIDYTLLRPEATEADIEEHCRQALKQGYTVVFVSGCWTERAVSALSGTGVAVGTVAGFPHGATFTAAKVREAEEAVQAGASQLDMVINIGWLKGAQDELVRDEIRAVRKALDGKAGLKVIIEAAYLTKEEKIRACRLAEEAGADFVKTSTGYGPWGATVEDVRLMRETVGDRLGVKASGGIRDLQTALKLLDAGADRIGTSTILGT